VLREVDFLRTTFIILFPFVYIWEFCQLEGQPSHCITVDESIFIGYTVYMFLCTGLFQDKQGR